MKDTGRPLFITKGGETEAVMLSAQAYDEMVEKAALSDSLAMLDQSMEDIKAGRTRPFREAAYIAEDSGYRSRAVDWLKQAYALTDTLEKMPRRCTIIPENNPLPYGVRKLNHHRHFILFTINDETKTVYVIGCRYGMRLPRPDDLPDEAPSE